MFAETVAKYGAIHHWRLGEVDSLQANDSIGTKHLTWSRRPKSVPGLVSMDLDGAIEIDGSWAISASSTLIPYTNNFTMLAVIQKNAINHYGHIFTNGDPATNGFSLAVSNTVGQPGNILSLQMPGTSNQALVVDRNIDADAKYLVCLVRKPTAWELWLNEFMVSSTGNVTPLTPTGNFVLGSNTVAGTQPFIGIIDEAAYFPVALAQNQITELTKIAFAHAPTKPKVIVTPTVDGKETITASGSIATTFPMEGYALWESYSSEFNFNLPPVATSLTGAFPARNLGRTFAIKAFDTYDYFSEPTIVPSSMPLTLERLATEARDQTTPAAIRSSISGRWADENNNYFDLTVSTIV